MGPDPAAAFLVLGDQLFAPDWLGSFRGTRVLMLESAALCGARRYHKQKLVMVLAAMRAYREELRAAGWQVDYRALGEAPPPPEAPEPFESALALLLDAQHPPVSELLMWEVTGKALERRLRRFARRRQLGLRFVPSPMFITPREPLEGWFAANRPAMASFYRWQRRRLRVLLDGKGRPQGGHWSFDRENRKRLPARVALPGVPPAEATAHVDALIPLVADRFRAHPGELSREQWWLPTTRAQARDALARFLAERLECFGPYEDALSQRDPHLFHAVLTPALNLGLLTPREILDATLEHSEQHPVPLASLEGFVRQLIGWREFVHGVYRCHSRRQLASNFFDHKRRLTHHWYDATTGLLPLDQVIAKVQRLGWAHHIERLMIVSNLMTLCEIDPAAAYDWFMELFVDASTWVMVPNVLGMGLFADGGLFSSKPYICGSNYLTRMSDEPRGQAVQASWPSILDGLYWRFIDRHRDFFAGQGRLSFAVRTLDRMDTARREVIFRSAESFLERTTSP